MYGTVGGGLISWYRCIDRYLEDMTYSGTIILLILQLIILRLIFYTRVSCDCGGCVDCRWCLFASVPSMRFVKVCICR